MSPGFLARLGLATCIALAPLPALAVEGAPDLVRTKDGGMLRGTIVEKVPGEKVTISLLDGQLRTLSMDTVTYAGPADEAPSARPPVDAADEVEPKSMVTVRTEEATLQLLEGETPLTWHTSSLSGVAFGGGMAVAHQMYNRLCTAPCEVEMPVGNHRFALATDDGIPVSALQPTRITGDGELVGVYEDNSTTRAVLAVIGLAGIIGGSVLMLAPLFEDDFEGDLGTGFWVGTGMLVVSPLVFSFAPPDRTRVEYRPR